VMMVTAKTRTIAQRVRLTRKSHIPSPILSPNAALTDSTPAGAIRLADPEP